MVVVTPNKLNNLSFSPPKNFLNQFQLPQTHKLVVQSIKLVSEMTRFQSKMSHWMMKTQLPNPSQFIGVIP